MRIRPRSGLVWLAVALLAIEFLGLSAVTILLIFETFTAPAKSLSSAVVLVILAAVAALGLALIISGMLRGRAWVRAAGIVWQVLQLFVGISALTGAGAQPTLAWPLIVVALALLALLFSPPVVAATAERRERGTS